MPLNLDLNRLGVAVCVVDVEGDGVFRFFGINDSAARESGLARESVAGKLFTDCLPADYARRLTERYAHCVRTRKVQETEEEVELAAGRKWFKTTLTPLIDEPSGRVTQIMGVSQNITATKRLQAELQEFAYVDQLTGLANRRRFDRAITEACEEAVYSGAAFSLAVVDLDGLKATNDRHGHRIGDAVIHYAGQLLTGTLRPGELVARVGGDEFYMLLRVGDRHALDVRLDAIRKLVDRGLILPGPDLPITLSIGGEIWRPGADIRDILSAADEAMYGEKEIRRLIRRIERRHAA